MADPQIKDSDLDADLTNIFANPTVAYEEGKPRPGIEQMSYAELYDYARGLEDQIASMTTEVQSAVAHKEHAASLLETEKKSHAETEKRLQRANKKLGVVIETANQLEADLESRYRQWLVDEERIGALQNEIAYLRSRIVGAITTTCDRGMARASRDPAYGVVRDAIRRGGAVPYADGSPDRLVIGSWMLGDAKPDRVQAIATEEFGFNRVELKNPALSFSVWVPETEEKKQ